MKATQVSALVSDYAPTLLASPLFQGFTEENLRNFFSHAELLVKDYKKNDFVALSGTPMEGLGIILEGALLITSGLRLLKQPKPARFSLFQSTPS